MKLLRDLARLPRELRSGAVSIGNFDGVHLGHARIVERLLTAARAVGGPAVAFTFDPHPAVLLRPDRAPPPLTTLAERVELLGRLGVDAVIAYPTDWALLELTPEAFFSQIVCEKLAARILVEGANFTFGRGRSGTIQVLRSLSAERGIEVSVVEPLELEGQVVSSSRIRKHLTEGQVAEAARLLGRPYSVRGHVAHGAGRGASIGFPTANLAGVETLLPAAGVYAGLATCDGRRWPAAINLGPNPTFGEPGLKLEAHLIGALEDLYGRDLQVAFTHRLREVRTFDGVEALKAQLRRDVEAAREAWEREQ